MIFSWAKQQAAMQQAASSIKKTLFGDLTPEQRELYRHDPLKGGVILDIETGGLKPGQPVVEVSIFDTSTGTPKTWHLKPYFKGKELTKEEFVGQVAEPWFRDRADTVFGDYWTQNQVHPEQFVRELAPHLKDKTVYIANAPFESRQLAELFKWHAGGEEFNSLRQMFETRPASGKSLASLFFVTGKELQNQRSLAFQTRDWMPVFESMMKGKLAGATGVRDIQDVARAIFSEGQRVGLLQDLDSYIGSSVNTLGLSYGMQPEVHRAAKDAIYEKALLEKLWGLGTGLHYARHGGLKAELELLFSDRHREGLTALKRLDSVRGHLKEKAVERSLAEARLNIEFLKNKKYDVVESYKQWMAPVEDYEGKVVRTSVGIPIKKIPRDFDEAVKMLTSERHIGKSLTKAQVDAMVLKIKMQDQTALTKMIHLTEEEAFEHSQLLTSMMDKAGKFNNWDASRIFMMKHPIITGLAAATGLALTGAAITTADERTSVPATDDGSYIDWHGLEPYGVASDLRKQITDFGSGYRGLMWSLSRLSKVPRSKDYCLIDRGYGLLGSIDLEQRASRFVKEVGSSDVVAAGRVTRASGLTISRNVNIFSRMSGKDRPRIQASTMSEFLVGSNRLADGYSGGREYNTISGLDHGAKIIDTGFGSSFKGIISFLDDAGRMARGFRRKGRVIGKGIGRQIGNTINKYFSGSRSFQQVMPGVFNIDEDVLGYLNSLAPKPFLGGVEGGAAGIALRPTKLLGAFTGVGREQALGFGLTRAQIAYATRTIREQQSYGLESIGLLSTSYLKKDAIVKTARHEQVHALITPETRNRLAELSKALIKQRELPLKTGWYGNPSQLLEEVTAYKSEGLTPKGAHFKSIFQEHKDLIEEVRAEVRRRAGYIEGLQSKGLGKTLRKKTDFGSPWQKLRAAMEVGRNFLMWGARKTGLQTLEMALYKGSAMRRGEVANLLRSSGVTRKEEEIETMINASRWLTVGNQKWQVMKKLGEGGFGEAHLVVSESGKDLGVFKRLTRAPIKGSMVATHQGDPLTYEKTLKAAREAFSESSGGPGIDTDYDFLIEEGVPLSWGKGEGGLMAMAQRAFSSIEHAAQPEWMKLQGKGAATVESALTYEVAMQEQAFREAQELGKNYIPRVLGGGRIDSGRVGDEGVGFIQEYGGTRLADIAKTLSPDSLSRVESNIRTYVQNVVDKGGVFNWDISVNNIVLNPKTLEPKIIDFGAASYIKGLTSEISDEHKTVFGNMVIERIFARYRGANNVASKLNVAESMDEAYNTGISAGRVLEEADPQKVLAAIQKKELAERVRMNDRLESVAKWQHDVHKRMFLSPTKHHKGGS